MRSSFFFLGALFALGACASTTHDGGTADNDVIGGVDAFSPKLDAVGAILVSDAQGNLAGLCTGTLIAPDLVLTAKHCAIDETPDPTTGQVSLAPHVSTGKVFFAIGPSISTSTRQVQATASYTCAADKGGSTGFGCDVAVFRLAEPIHDIEPIAVATTSMPGSAIGTSFSVIGYGSQSTSANVVGTRKMATMTVRAVTGAGLPTLFPSFDDYQNAVVKLEGREYAKQYDAFMRFLYGYALLDEYEVAVGGRPGNGQDCPGDSGGPVLANENGKLVIYGVDSTGDIPGVRVSCHSFGSIYATFGPEAQLLLQPLLARP